MKEIKTFQLYRYNSRWVDVYDAEIKRIRKIIPHGVGYSTMHIGSTAIEGALTSGNLDLAIGVHNPLNLITIRDLLVRRGYKLNEKESAGNRVILNRKLNDYVNIIIYIVAYDSDLWRRMIIFKDYMLSKGSNLDDYNEFRLNLFYNRNVDKVAYEKEKTAYIEQLLDKIS